MLSTIVQVLLTLVLAIADQGVVRSVESPVRAAEPEAQASTSPAPAAVGLEALYDDPRPWFGREVRFTFQLAELPELWNPGMTRFGARDFVAVRVWADGQLLWREADWSNPVGLVFARRGEPLAEALGAAPTYARFTARGRVVEVFLGRPWIELTELRAEGRSIGEGTILHASRALRLMASEDWQLAREDLLRATAGPLPEHAREALRSLLATCEEGLRTRAARRVPVQRR